MPYSIELMADRKYVSLVMTGNLTKKDFENSREEIANLLADHNLSWLLVDGAQGAKEISLSEDFQFIKDLKLHFPVDVRIALVVSSDEFQNNRFVEDVSQNRGINLKAFMDKSQAVDWLVGGE